MFLSRALAAWGLLALTCLGVLDEGMIPLFNGRTLEGWHTNPETIGHGTGGDWQVVEGAIVGQQDPPGSGNGGILLSDQKFGDFELTLELKPDWGVDSGLFLRANDQGQCFQVMVDYHDNGNVGHIYGEGTGGFSNRPFEIVGEYADDKSLSKVVARPLADPPPGQACTADEWTKAWKVGEWNVLKVRVVGNPPRITTWINDLLVSEFDGAAFAGEAYNKDMVAEQLGPTGSIALQVHGGTGAWPNGAVCRYRNLKIKPL
jgi:hypothetical protein